MLVRKNIKKIEDQKLRDTILTFVEAADQMLKEQDPTGEARKQYVVDSLNSMDIEVDEYVNALIEQAVLGLWYYQPNKEEPEI